MIILNTQAVGKSETCLTNKLKLSKISIKSKFSLPTIFNQQNPLRYNVDVAFVKSKFIVSFQHIMLSPDNWIVHDT